MKSEQKHYVRSHAMEWGCVHHQPHSPPKPTLDIIIPVFEPRIIPVIHHTISAAQEAPQECYAAVATTSKPLHTTVMGSIHAAVKFVIKHSLSYNLAVKTSKHAAGHLRWRRAAGSTLRQHLRLFWGGSWQGTVVWCGAATWRGTAVWCGAATWRGTAVWCGAATWRGTAVWCGATTWRGTAVWCGAATWRWTAVCCGATTWRGTAVWCESAAWCWRGAAGNTLRQHIRLF